MNLIRKLLSISFFVFLILACKTKKEVDLIKIQEKLESSHKIKNDIILDPINAAIKKVEKEPLYDAIILKIDSFKKNEQKIYVKITNFRTEQAFCQLEEPCQKPNGYMTIDNIPILLFGDLELFFTQIKRPKDILYTADKIDLLVSMHNPYLYYIYHKDTIFGDYQEFIEYKGQIDNIY